MAVAGHIPRLNPRRFGTHFDTREEIYIARYVQQRELALSQADGLLALSGWRVPHSLTQTEDGWYV